MPLPSGTTRGSMVGTALDARAAASSSSVLVAKRPMACEVADGGEDDLDLAGPVALERVVGRDPHLGDRLAGVVRGDLAGRRGGHEEAGVVAARAPRGVIQCAK